MLDAASTDRAFRLIRNLEDRYAFLGMLGKGGSGLVFEVENRQLGRKEAIKILGQIYGRNDSRRFAHEARMMAALDHPHIIPIYAFGEAEGCLWYSMKLVEGPTLFGYLQHAPQPGLPEACQVAIPLLAALALSHEQGIVHRDIKPANILLDPAAGPLLTDFGIAKAESDPMLTETGLVLGTPAYVSPEQCLGQKVDGRADLYALGMSLYHLLAGRLPFEPGSSLALLIQRFREDPTPLGSFRPDLPEALLALIARAMARRPEDRYDSALDARKAFLHLAETARVDWQRPLQVPPGLGPKRSPLPEAFLGPVTGPTPTIGSLTDALKAHDPNRPRPVQGPTEGKGAAAWRRHRRALASLALLLALAGGWALARIRRTPAVVSNQPPAIPVQPAASRLPEEKKASPAMGAQRPHPAQEPPLLRRAVTPPQLIETPRAFLPEDSPCGGQSVTVELQVDEAGIVISARLLSKVSAGCTDPILQAARGCKFKPALASDGQPVTATLAIALEP